MSTICDDLRKSILRTAITGRLTEQLASDTPIKKVLDANNILHDNEKEYPFDIPENWAWVKLKAVANVQYGFPFNSQLFNKNEKGMPLIRIRDILPAKTSTYTTEKAPENYLIKKNDMLVGMDGNFNVNFWNSEDAYLNQRCCKIAAGLYLKQKLLYWFLQIFLDEIFENVSYTTVKHLSDRHLTKMSIPLPPLAEQKRIIEKVDELMARVADLEQSADALASLKKTFPDDIKASLLQAAMQGKLTKQLPGDGDMNETFRSHSFDEISIKYGLKMDSMDFEIPNTWAMATMDELFNFVDYRGKTPHKIKDGKIFLITSSNIKNGVMDYTRKEYISEAEYAERQTRGITHRGDLLFTTEAPMGNAAICDLEVCSCGQRIITFQEKEKNTVMPELFMYFILSPSFQKQLEDNCTGTTAKGIKGAKLKHFLIPVPPLAEQRRIVERLERLMQNINVVGDLIASE